MLPLEVDETFGLAMLEAMACGTPVLAYARGAVPEVVAHGETGFAVLTYEELRDSLPRLAGMDPHRCRAHVAKNFSRDAMVAAYLKLYDEMCRADKDCPGGDGASPPLRRGKLSFKAENGIHQLCNQMENPPKSSFGKTGLPKRFCIVPPLAKGAGGLSEGLG